MYAKERKMIKAKRKKKKKVCYAMLCLCLSVCLSARSLEMPLHHHHQHPRHLRLHTAAESTQSTLARGFPQVRRAPHALEQWAEF